MASPGYNEELLGTRVSAMIHLFLCLPSLHVCVALCVCVVCVCVCVCVRALQICYCLCPCLTPDPLRGWGRDSFSNVRHEITSNIQLQAHPSYVRCSDGAFRCGGILLRIWI